MPNVNNIAPNTESVAVSSDSLVSINPLVTAVIPVYNGSAYIDEAVESILANTFKDIQILLINDGSTDNSHEKCTLLSQKYLNIDYHSFEVNRGLGETLNYALSHAKGTYICRLNQDDKMLPNRIEKQVAFLQKNPEVVAVGAWILLFDNKGNKQVVKYQDTDEAIRKTWLMLGPFADPTVMYSKQAALDVGGYEQKYWPADDTHLWFKLGKVGKMANIPEPLVEVRWHKDAGSVKYASQMAFSLYRAHRYAHNNVQKAPLWLQVFWVGQFLSGWILPANFNWSVYRIIKRFVSTLFPPSNK